MFNFPVEPWSPGTLDWSTPDLLRSSDKPRSLSAVGCERTFSEQVSSVGKREQLEAAISFARDGDTFIITRLDRLARSTQDLLGIVERLDKKGVALRILDFAGSAIDTTKAVDKLLITVFGAFAEFERNLMLERQREGIAKAKVEGKYRGEPPRHAQRRIRFGRLRRRDSQRGRSPTGLDQRAECVPCAGDALP